MRPPVVGTRGRTGWLVVGDLRRNGWPSSANTTGCRVTFQRRLRVSPVHGPGGGARAVCRQARPRRRRDRPRLIFGAGGRVSIQRALSRAARAPRPEHDGHVPRLDDRDNRSRRYGLRSAVWQLMLASAVFNAHGPPARSSRRRPSSNMPSARLGRVSSLDWLISIAPSPLVRPHGARERGPGSARDHCRRRRRRRRRHVCGLAVPGARAGRRGPSSAPARVARHRSPWSRRPASGSRLSAALDRAAGRGRGPTPGTSIRPECPSPGPMARLVIVTPPRSRSSAGSVEVVGHQVELLTPALLGRGGRRAGGWEREDQPA